MKQRIKLRELKLRNLRFKRRQYRVLLVTLGIVATVVLAFNFWFIDHAEEAIEQIVSSQSNGKMKLKVGKFKFNWIKNKIELQDAVFYTTDTATAATLYQLSTKKITVKAKGFLPLLFRKQILIDSIHLYAPSVVFTRIKVKDEDTIPKPRQDTLNVAIEEEFSVAKEMGRISKTINNAISVLQIERFILDDGSFSLIDNTKPAEKPFVVNKINIRLDNLQVDSTSRKSKDKILFTDNIAVQTSDQNIVFPGGRHFLSFKNFKVNLQNQRVEFDSCTVRSIKGDSSKSSFRIYFDKLQMTRINFDTLYNAEVIKADSVFCTNPDILFDVDSDQQTASKNKKGIQNVDQLVQQLLGDIMLNYVVVKNADIHINTIKGGKTNTFSSQNNDFELQGLLVRQNYERPINVTKFVMSLHNYETALQNGRYAIAFDSVLFHDNAINLNRFSFKEFSKGNTIKSISMPAFELRGLSWESLLYDNIFNARDAVFYKPVIHYTVIKKTPGKAKSIFETLSDLGSVMNLTNLSIKDGAINLNLGKGATLNLQNTNLALLPDELTASKKIKNIQHSVQQLIFSKGSFEKGATHFLLNNVRLADNKSGLRASSLSLRDRGVNAVANSIGIKTILLDSTNQNISMEGLSWANAKVNIVTGKREKKTQKDAPKTGLLLKHIKGGNTAININQGNKKIAAFFTTIAVDEVARKTKGAPEISGLSLAGRDFLLIDPEQRLSVDQLIITDNNNSILRNINFQKVNDVDSIWVQIPQITIIPDITKIISGHLFLNNLIISDPEIVARLGRKDTTIEREKKKTPEIILGTALLERPKIELTIFNKNNLPGFISWNGVKENSYVKLTNFKSTEEQPAAVQQMKIFLTNFDYINSKGKRFATNDNKLNIEFNDLLLQKSDSNKLDWNTSVNILSLDKLLFDSLGRNNAVLQLDKGDVRNITLNSKYINNVGDIIKNSSALQITGTNGSYTSLKNKVYWHNLNFDKGFFRADSFSLSPLQSVEDYRRAKAFNEDYLRINSGQVKGGPFDMIKYGQDSILSIGGLQFDNIRLLTFKDKTQPDTAKKYKLLPTHQILAIPTKLDIDSLRLKNMYVEYWEINPQTDTLGIIPVSNLNVIMNNIKNYDIKPQDSLYISASADVINSLFTKLEVRESYIDTAGSFLMKLSTGPLDLKKFNEILVPLVAAEVLRGNLDSLNMTAIGNNDYSTGSMRMYYQDLKLRLLDKKDLANQTLLNKIVSWAANAFIVRHNNNGKNSPVFFERLQDKSPINFLIKTTISGLKSSVGLPGVKGKQKRYLRKVEKQKKQ